MAKSIIEIQEQITTTINNNNYPVFFPGIRGEVAILGGIAPNNAAFHAAFDSLEWWQSGPGVLRAGIPWEDRYTPLIRQRF